jgi:crotonobetaine/carnitine-CoA ligase
MTPEQTFAQMVAQGDIALDKLAECAKRTPDKTFIHYGEDGVRLTFAQFVDITDRFAGGLLEAGVAPGDSVSVLTRNSLVSAIAMFGIWRAGCLFAPINFNFKGPQLSYQLADTRPAALVTDPSFLEILEEIGASACPPRLVIHTPKAGDHDHAGATFPSDFGDATLLDFAALCAHRAKAPPVSPGPFDLANIVYTSGTTGPSKGVLQNFRWINQYTFFLRAFTSENDVIYCDLPLYHVGGAFALLARAVWKGNTVGLWDRFSPTQFWERIAEVGATYAILLDVMTPWLLGAPPRDGDRGNTLSIVHMQPLPPNHREVATRFGVDFVTAGFGQTESGNPFVGMIDELGDEEGARSAARKGYSRTQMRELCNQLGVLVVDGAAKLPTGFMGKPSPLLEVAILDDDDNRCAPGVVGQLGIRPRFPGLLLQEYFRKPEATLKTFRNLWFHTGDACAEIPDGSGVYRFVDRMGGFFRVRGENVSSFEVEALISRHPKVQATAALPIPAAEGSEDDIVAFVQPVAGEQPTEAEIRDHARAVMPKYMIPRHIRFVEALPVTPTNKVEKYKLKQQIAKELGL